MDLWQWLNISQQPSTISPICLVFVWNFRMLYANLQLRGKQTTCCPLLGLWTADPYFLPVGYTHSIMHTTFYITILQEVNGVWTVKAPCLWIVKSRGQTHVDLLNPFLPTLFKDFGSQFRQQAIINPKEQEVMQNSSIKLPHIGKQIQNSVHVSAVLPRKLIGWLFAPWVCACTWTRFTWDWRLLAGDMNILSLYGNTEQCNYVKASGLSA